jgi:uncharacterized protein YjbI with pentapeptide repeats
VVYFFGAILLLVVFALGAFFWAWWAVPRDRVLPHLSPEELKLLETEDRLRQTNYQLLAGGALVFTFCLTMYQSVTSYRQWIEDHSVRSQQAKVTHLSEAMKALSAEKGPAVRIAGFYSLRQLALIYPDQEAELATAVLLESVRSTADKDTVGKWGKTVECNQSESGPYNREEAAPELQTAMRILGDSVLADARNLVHDGTRCRAKTAGKPSHFTNLSHLLLDNLDLAGSNFACMDMTQSHFRRTNFSGANLQGALFGGASFDDWKTPGFLDAINRGEPVNEGKNRAVWLYEKEADWRRHRCWVASFANAKLIGANFRNAGLGGVDFREADLTNAILNGANISRANFRGARVLASQLQVACADEQPLHEFPIEIKKCAAQSPSAR